MNWVEFFKIDIFLGLQINLTGCIQGIKSLGAGGDNC